MPCKTGKRRYRDRIAAQLALATLKKDDREGHTEERAYSCPYCGGWHLTSEEQKASE